MCNYYVLLTTYSYFVQCVFVAFNDLRDFITNKQNKYILINQPTNSPEYMYES